LRIDKMSFSPSTWHNNLAAQVMHSNRYMTIKFPSIQSILSSCKDPISY